MIALTSFEPGLSAPPGQAPDEMLVSRPAKDAAD